MSVGTPLARLTQSSEMKVGVLEVEGDRGRRLGGTARRFPRGRARSVREVDADAMLSPRSRA